MNGPLPPWKEFPNTHPYDIHWRMGSGESYIGVFWDWLGPQTDEARWSYFRQHLPIPFEWLPIVADSLTGSNDNEQFAMLEFKDCDAALYDPAYFTGIRKLAAECICNFDDFAFWLRAELLLMDKAWQFEQILFERVVARIRAWDLEQYPDIYALSFLYGECSGTDSEGNERSIHTCLSVSFNTIAHYVSQIEEASDATEAKWNFAFWLHEESINMPQLLDEYGTIDAADCELQEAWLAVQKPHHDNEHEALLDHYTELAHRLHEEKILTNILGRNVPIILHNLIYEEASDIATRRANPPALLTEYLAGNGL